MNLHYCYFLDPIYGPAGSSGNAPSAWHFISPTHFDNRCPQDRQFQLRREPYFMPLMQTHMTGGGEQPLKWYNNTIIWAPDAQSSDSFRWPTCVATIRPCSSRFHEVFNNIWVRNDYQRYNASDPVRQLSKQKRRNSKSHRLRRRLQGDLRLQDWAWSVAERPDLSVS